MFKYKKIVIKIGSNVLAGDNLKLDEKIIEHLVDQISALSGQGIEIVLVSSGAVASGRGMVTLGSNTDSVSKRQVLAAVGQVRLLHSYYNLFEQKALVCAQVLVTKDDFRDKSHYFNMQNCFTNLLLHKVIPIVNENDVISITELMFTDNDELAALISTMLNAEALIILSNVDGIYDGDPKNPVSKVISVIDEKQLDFSKFIQETKSDFGRGGMITKCNMALKVAKTGISVHIANGKKQNILLDLLQDRSNKIGTTFVPLKSTSSIKKRIAFADTFGKGKIVVNEGARNALLSQNASSLLTIGISTIEGEFQAGDVVKIWDESGAAIGIGKVQYGSAKAREMMGQKGNKPLIHYDYLFLEFK